MKPPGISNVSTCIPFGIVVHSFFGSVRLPLTLTPVESRELCKGTGGTKPNGIQKMDKSMQVGGMGERTREAYLRSMRQLIEHYDKSPDLIAEDKLLDFFIHRQNVTGWSPATMRICYSGVKFFFKHVLKKDWHLLAIAQARRERRPPAPS